MTRFFARIGGEHRGRLVYTGEDYPWGPFGRADDLLATKAVRAGLGVAGQDVDDRPVRVG
jgi:hypothetical protein